MTNARNLERDIHKQFRRHDLATFSRPELILPRGESGRPDEAAVQAIEQKKRAGCRVLDLFSELLLELLLVEHPEFKTQGDRLKDLYHAYKSDYLRGSDEEHAGAWVHYANGTLIHLLRPEDHYRLRTSRNLGLLVPEEQDKLRHAHVAIGGLSVGGLCATTLAMEGVNSFFLTDLDQLSCSNLNRLSSSLSMIGVDKTNIVAAKIWDIDPFATVLTNDSGYNEATERAMFNSARRPDVAIDAMDSMEAKVAIREACRQHRVPLVWMIDMGDGVVQIGTERYDRDASYPAFHGNLARMEQRLGRSLNYVERCFSIFSHDHIPYRMADSFYKACNSQWPGISQLAGTVCIAAGAVSTVVRKLLWNEEVTPEFFIDVNEKADPDYVSHKAADRERTHRFMAELGLR